jgi:hypothetical protein
MPLVILYTKVNIWKLRHKYSQFQLATKYWVIQLGFNLQKNVNNNDGCSNENIYHVLQSNSCKKIMNSASNSTQKYTI